MLTVEGSDTSNKLVQSLNAHISMTLRLLLPSSRMTTSSSERHSQKENRPIRFTLWGIVMRVREWQPQKVSSSITTSCSGNCTNSRARQFLKAPEPITLTVFGKAIVCNEMHPQNARGWMEPSCCWKEPSAKSTCNNEVYFWKALSPMNRIEPNRLLDGWRSWAMSNDYHCNRHDDGVVRSAEEVMSLLFLLAYFCASFSKLLVE